MTSNDIPNFALAFEYQGRQHYGTHFFFGSDHVGLADRDRQKEEKCVQAGITLVQVPFWWNNEKDSLEHLIHQIRPDIVSPSSDICSTDWVPKAASYVDIPHVALCVSAKLYLG